MELKMAHYGEEREINASDGEIEIYEKLISILPHRDEFRLVRISNDYVTLKYGVWDIARFKSTDRTQWIVFPNQGTKKIRFGSVDELDQYLDVMLKQISEAEKYGLYD